MDERAQVTRASSSLSNPAYPSGFAKLSIPKGEALSSLSILSNLKIGMEQLLLPRQPMAIEMEQSDWAVWDLAGVDYTSCFDPALHPDHLRERLAAVLLGKFEAPGLVDSRDFQNIRVRHALGKRAGSWAERRHRRDPLRRSVSAEQGIPSLHDFRESILYEAMPESPSPGRLNKVYTDFVGDWQLLQGRVFNVTWWGGSGEEEVQTDRFVRFLSYRDLRRVHTGGLAGSGGPCDPGWCLPSIKDLTISDSEDIDLDVFWSSSILYKLVGSSGVKFWDEQLREMEEDIVYYMCGHQ